jgi:hypothetical protein
VKAEETTDEDILGTSDEDEDEDEEEKDDDDRLLLRSAPTRNGASGEKLPDLKWHDGEDPSTVAEAYCAKHKIGKSTAPQLVAALLAEETVEPVNGWFPLDADDPKKKDHFEECKTVEETHQLFSRCFLPVKFKKVMWGSKEVFERTGGQGGMNGSPHFFCGSCTGIWKSHHYPAQTNPKARTPHGIPQDYPVANPKVLRSCCKFCKSKVHQDLVLFSTGL